MGCFGALFIARDGGLGCFQPFILNPEMSGVSIKQPFQSGYLMDISRGIERLEIAQTGQFESPLTIHSVVVV
jgi:hypothetical protein